MFGKLRETAAIHPGKRIWPDARFLCAEIALSEDD